MVERLAQDAPGDTEHFRLRYHDLYVRRCTADGWSSDAQECFLAPGRAAQCASLLTARQLNMIECIDDAAVKSGMPPTNPTDRAAVEKACEQE